MSTLALTIGYLQHSNITCFMIIKEESFHSNAAYLTEYLLTNHSPAPRVWGNVETAARHGRWGGDLDFHFFLDLKSKRWSWNWKLMVVVQLALITGSGKGGAIILWLGPPESDWNPFQLNVTNGYLWQLEKLHQMKSISATETQWAS